MTPASTSPETADLAPIPDDLTPEAERLISDAETLKALSDPLRLRILETMVTRAGEPWSVKELAAAMGVPQTRLYHHIDLLAERDLIRPAAQRVISGIIETRYRIAALSMRLDPRLLSGEGAEGAGADAVVATVLDTARSEIVAALRAASLAPEGTAAPDRPLLSRGVALLRPARAAELRARIDALTAEYESDPTDPEAKPYGMLIAMYAVPKTAADPADD
jgi:DNA-binding transcriptional ArsR family regulator